MISGALLVMAMLAGLLLTGAANSVLNAAWAARRHGSVPEDWVQ